MKKLYTLIIVFLLSLVMVTACAKAEDEKPNEPVTENETSNVNQEATDDTANDLVDEPTDASDQEMPEESSDPTEGLDDQAISQVYLDLLIEGDYESAYNNIPHHPDMASAVSPEIYEQIMVSLSDQLGSFVEVIGTSYLEDQGYHIYQYHTNFELMTITLNIVMQDGQVSGFNYVPYEAPATESSLYDEITVTVGREPFLLEGLLTIPTGLDAYPLVILVQGSGASDKDETIGPNKPFQDIAHSLGEAGIASLRYDKRSYVYGLEMASDINGTVFEEVIDDVVSALELVRGDDTLNVSHVYVAGHSLGGFLIPRIDDTTDLADGYIMMAGPARNLDVLMLEQLAYLALNPELSDAELAQIQAMEVEVERLEDLSVLSDDEMILGGYKAYFEDLLAYDALESALDLSKPLLILQGERDYQVTMVDFNLWQDAIGDKDNVTMISYPNLNHLMMAGDEASTPDEYFISGHVDDEMIQDMIDFITSY